MDPIANQEVRVSIVEGDYKLDFRVETHNRVQNIFKDLSLNKDDYVRHANIQFYQRIEGTWREINVPGTNQQNYHI